MNIRRLGKKEDSLISLESCEALVISVLKLGMDHINNLRVKYIWVLLCYYLGLESLKWIPKKVERVEDVTDLFRREWEGITNRVGGGGVGGK